MKAEETWQVTTQAEASARNAGGAAMGAEADVTTHQRTKAELEQASGLMEAVCERDNLKLAHQRVVGNKGAAGVDGIGVAEFKDHLKRHWPTIKAKLLAGEFMPQPVRRVDIPKPQGGVRTLGIPTLTDRLIQQALHQVLSRIFEADFSASSYGFFDRGGTPIKRSRRTSSTLPKVAGLWWTWIWRIPSTVSITIS
jgi:RNA-directed DNA polymerase